MSGRCSTCGEVGDVWCGECLGPHPDDAVATREKLREDNARLTAENARLAGQVAALRSVMAWAEDRGYLDPGGHEDDGPSEDLWAAMFAALRTYSAALAEQGEAG